MAEELNFSEERDLHLHQDTRKISAKIVPFSSEDNKHSKIEQTRLLRNAKQNNSFLKEISNC